MQPHGMSMKLRAHISNLKRSQVNVSIVSYAQFPGIMNCQTKMVLGHACAKDISLSSDDLDEAKRRVKYDFLFIGLTEFPLQTEHLYRSMFTSETTDIEAFKPYLKVRENKNHNSRSNRELKRTLEENNFSDYFDDSLYAEVRKIFEERCNFYNISIPLSD